MNRGEKELDVRVCYLMRDFGMPAEEARDLALAQMEREARSDVTVQEMLLEIQLAEQMRKDGLKVSGDGFADSWNSDRSFADGTEKDAIDRMSGGRDPV